MTFDELIKKRSDEWVFQTRSGDKADLFNLSRSFRAFLEHNDMRIGSDGRARTLYSFRHFYTTQALKRGMNTHALSRQLGNSTKVVDQFYSDLSPLMNADQHSGRDRQKLKEKAQGKDAGDHGTNSVAEKAFEMLLTGQLSEEALLSTVGAGRAAYEPTTHIKMLALEAVEAGKLTESGLFQLLNLG